MPTWPNGRSDTMPEHAMTDITWIALLAALTLLTLAFVRLCERA